MHLRKLRDLRQIEWHRVVTRRRPMPGEAGGPFMGLELRMAAPGVPLNWGRPSCLAQSRPYAIRVAA